MLDSFFNSLVQLDRPLKDTLIIGIKHNQYASTAWPTDSYGSIAFNPHWLNRVAYAMRCHGLTQNIAVITAVVQIFTEEYRNGRRISFTLNHEANVRLISSCSHVN
jgi:hypothetical protein